MNDEWDENEALYYPTKQDNIDYDWNEKDGFLKALVEEVINNGYKSDLCQICPNGYNSECKHNDFNVMELVGHYEGEYYAEYIGLCGKEYVYHNNVHRMYNIFLIKYIIIIFIT